jgi:hypothetical protein
MRMVRLRIVVTAVSLFSATTGRQKHRTRETKESDRLRGIRLARLANKGMGPHERKRICDASIVVPGDRV